MDKAARLKMIREIAKRHQEQELLALGTIPLSGREVEEEVHELDAHREERRDKASSVKGRINSDE